MKAINLFWLWLFVFTLWDFTQRVKTKGRKVKKKSGHPPISLWGRGGEGEDLVVPICLKNLGDFIIFLFKLENCILGLFNISSKRF